VSCLQDPRNHSHFKTYSADSILPKVRACFILTQPIPFSTIGVGFQAQRGLMNEVSRQQQIASLDQLNNRPCFNTYLILVDWKYGVPWCTQGRATFREQARLAARTNHNRGFIFRPHYASSLLRRATFFSPLKNFFPQLLQLSPPSHLEFNYQNTHQHSQIWVTERMTNWRSIPFDFSRYIPHLVLNLM